MAGTTQLRLHLTLVMNLILALAGMQLVAPPAYAQFGLEPPGRPPAEQDNTARLAAKKAYEQNRARYADNPDMLVLPGLLADRKAKTVRIWAKFTRLGYGDPVEFFLIPPDSGKDYEALFVGFVKPSDVHRALEFIGMKPGRPVDFRANYWWPKGERVLMTAEWEQPAAKHGTSPASIQQVRVEELILDVEAKEHLPKTGLVFTGSYRIQPDEPGRKELYAADVVDPRSIASDFNEPTTVLDVPRLAIKGEVYGRQKLNPAYRFVPDQPVQLLLEPEYKDGRTRVRDLTLRVSMPPGNATPGIGAARFVVTDTSGRQINQANNLIHLLATFNKITEAGQDPFVTVHLDDGMTVAQVRELYKLLMAMDTENGIRIEAPPEGHLFYRAFFPNEDWRDRQKRLGRPWELHANIAGQTPSGILILPADEIDDNNGLGDLQFEVNSGQEVARILLEKSDRWSRMVYVFAPPEMKYGALMSMVRQAMQTHPTIYVFLTS